MSISRGQAWVVGGKPPERIGDLWLEMTALPSQPHFTVDPAWPPHGHYVEPRDPVRVPKPPRQPHVFPPGHVWSVTCPVCGVGPGKQCREVNRERKDYVFGQPRCAHDERCRLAWNRVEAQWDPAEAKVKVVEKLPVRVTSVPVSQAERILEEICARWKLKEELDALWKQILEGQIELEAVKARIKFYQEKYK